jgi:hypothetical protein
MAFNQKKADELCELLRSGLSLRKAAEQLGMAPSTVLLWAKESPFSEQYARAREVGYQLLADEILDISDDGRGDTWVDEEGIVRTNQDVVARSRLRVDSRKWMLSKMLPKIYGDKVDIEHSGSVSVEIVRFSSELTQK